MDLIVGTGICLGASGDVYVDGNPKHGESKLSWTSHSDSNRESQQVKWEVMKASLGGPLWVTEASSRRK